MNVIANLVSPKGDAPQPPLAGELVVNNGRMKGTRRPLADSLTLIGQAAHCEVRLNVEGVKPLHCAIAHGPEGYVLRDLTGESSTQVNGQKVSLHHLHDGDVLVIGPFQFLVAIPEPLRPESIRKSAASVSAQRDALRIQAAAVASQQAGLTEEEIRLEKRRIALMHQEEDLAARLDERQRELRQLDQKLRSEWDALDREREAESQRQAEARAELEKVQTETQTTAREVAGQRRRLVELRKRLKRRWLNQWQAQQAEMDRRDRALAATQARLEAESVKLDSEQQKLSEARWRLNGELELGRRKLQEEWRELGLAQQQWEATLNAEHAERQRCFRSLEERQQAMARAESALQDEQRSWLQQRAVLEKDVQGLENRVRNQRQKLLDLAQTKIRHDPQGEVISWPGTAPQTSAIVPRHARDADTVLLVDIPELAPATVRGALLSEAIQRVAAMVADQRWHQLEQWERLLRLQEHWEAERGVVLAKLEEAGQRLQQREQRLDERTEQLRKHEAALEARVVQLQERQETLSQLRCSLEGWQARLEARNTAWEAEREEVLSGVRAREERVATQVFRAQQLHARRTNRLRHQAQTLRIAQERSEKVRTQYVALWKAYQQRFKTLVGEQQTLARQSLTLERYRSELLTQADDAVTAEKRLARLQRICDAQAVEAERQLEGQRQDLKAEMDRIEGRAQVVAQMETVLAQRQIALSSERTELENQQAALHQGEAQRRLEIEALQVRYRLAEEQIHKLREEVERLAQMLLQEVDATLPPANPTAQAA